MSWTTFWFETNSAWGLVDSPEAWKAMRENWNKGAHGYTPILKPVSERSPRRRSVWPLRAGGFHS